MKDTSVAVFKKAAKELVAADRRRKICILLQTQAHVYNQYRHPDSPRYNGQTYSTASGPNGSSAKKTNHGNAPTFTAAGMPEIPVDWDQPAYLAGRQMTDGITIRMMLNMFTDGLRLAATDFDKMSLAEHIQYIQSKVEGRRVKMCEITMSKALLGIAMRQRHQARRNFVGWISKTVSYHHVPDAVAARFKQCGNCKERFWPNAEQCPFDVLGKRCVVHHPCQFHPGHIVCDHEPTTESFKKWEVNVSDFNLWATNLNCRWSCCGARVVKHRNDEDELDDESPGCVVQQHREGVR
ncbi:hypothetical protein AAE478_002889 [Parahypoxylon ruwenzoriense]